MCSTHASLIGCLHVDCLLVWCGISDIDIPLQRGCEKAYQSETGVILLVPFWSDCKEHQRRVNWSASPLLSRSWTKCVLALVPHLEFETWNVNSICRMTYLTGHFMSHWIPNVFWIQRAKVLNANPDGKCLEGRLPAILGDLVLTVALACLSRKRRQIGSNWISSKNHPVQEHVLLAFFRDALHHN